MANVITKSSLIAMAAMLVSGEAIAQTPGNAPDSSGNSEQTGLEDIVVTAQRVQQSAQDVAMAINVVNSSTIEQQGVTSVGDLQKLLPSLHVGGGTYKQFYVRGVGSVNLSSLTDAAVAVNLDGVYISRPSATNGLFYDLDRIEVLKGPQGTLYGRNATAGAINIITKKPELDSFGGNLGLEFGNYQQRRVWGALNVPMADKIALRAAFQIEKRDGYFSDGTGDQDSKAARLSLKLVPDENLSIVIVGDYDHEGGIGPGGTLVPFIDKENPYLGMGDPRIRQKFAQTLFFPAGNFFSPVTFTPFLRAEYWGISSEIKWQNPLGELVLVPAYRRSSLDTRTNSTGIDWREDGRDRQFSIEARLVSPTDKAFRWILGGYYLDEENVYRAQYNTGFLVSLPTFQTNLKSAAAFGRITYELSSPLRVSVGVRYTHDEKSLAGTQTSGNVICPAALFGGQALGCVGGYTFPYDPFNLPPQLLQSIAQQGALIPIGTRGNVVTGSIVTQTSKDTFEKVTWHAGVEWDIAPDSLAYINVDTGFKAGGAFFSNDAKSYRPEKLTAYAVGIKNTLFNNRVRLNAELFYWEYDDQQITYLTLDSTQTVFLTTQNVGKSTYKGVEIEAQIALGRGTQIKADVQYLDAVYKRFTYNVPNFGAPPFQGCRSSPNGALNTIDCSGRPAINAPKWRFNLGAEQAIQLGSNGGSLTLAANLKYQSGSFTNIDYIDQQFQGEFAILDAQIVYESPNGNWSVTGFAKNITNRAIKSFSLTNPSANEVLSSAALYAPRTYGLRLAFSF